jgi:hypothetical protein
MTSPVSQVRVRKRDKASTLLFLDAMLTPSSAALAGSQIIAPFKVSTHSAITPSKILNVLYTSFESIRSLHTKISDEIYVLVLGFVDRMTGDHVEARPLRQRV